jgi:hypothetical protein
LDQRLSKQRILIGMLALYAVMLQAFVVSALPVAVFDSFGGIVCLQDVGTPNPPGNDRHRHHGVCCILACAAFSFAAAVAASGLAVFPELLVSLIVFGMGKAWSVRSPLKFYFAARGPPFQSV